MDISVIDTLNLIIAILAFSISVMSLYRSYMSGRPYIKLIDMFFEPSEFHCYSLEIREGYEELTESYQGIIKDTLGRVRYTRIDEKGYLLVNSLSDNFDFRNVRLVLAPYQFTYANTGSFVCEMQLIKGIFKLRDKEVYEKDINCVITPEGVGDERINIRIAYVCEEGNATSVIYDRLLQETERFSYKDNTEKAKRIINFEKEEFIVKCKNNAKNKYIIKVIYEWDGNELKIISE